MTDDERRTEIGRLVEDRQKIKASLICIDRRLGRIRRALEQTKLAIDEQASWSFDRVTGALTIAGLPNIHGCEDDSLHPSGNAIGELLDERKKLRDNLDELERQSRELGI